MLCSSRVLRPISRNCAGSSPHDISESMRGRNPPYGKKPGTTIGSGPAFPTPSVRIHVSAYSKYARLPDT